jgi:hypothetical protein
MAFRQYQQATSLAIEMNKLSLALKLSKKAEKALRKTFQDTFEISGSEVNPDDSKWLPDVTIALGLKLPLKNKAQWQSYRQVFLTNHHNP